MERGPNEADDDLGSAFEAHPDILLEIGRAVALWGAISHLLRSLTVAVLDCQPAQAEDLLSSFPGEEKRIQFLIDLLATKGNGEEERALTSVLRRLKKLCADRNLIVHGAPIKRWHEGARPGTEYFLNMRKREESERYIDARQLLTTHVAKLKQHGGELFDLVYPDVP
jgi:hypothetical protein